MTQQEGATWSSSWHFSRKVGRKIHLTSLLEARAFMAPSLWKVALHQDLTCLLLALNKLSKTSCKHSESSFPDHRGLKPPISSPASSCAGASLNARSSEGTTPLVAAIEGGHENTFYSILERNVDTNMATAVRLHSSRVLSP